MVDAPNFRGFPSVLRQSDGNIAPLTQKNRSRCPGGAFFGVHRFDGIIAVFAVEREGARTFLRLIERTGKRTAAEVRLELKYEIVAEFVTIQMRWQCDV
jgi:hypothetical protein